MSEEKKEKNSQDDPISGLFDGVASFTDGKIFDGMANLVGKLGDLAQKGKELKDSVDFESKDGQTVKGSYGFSVRFGADGGRSDDLQVEPVQPTAGSAKSPPKEKEVREPLVDIFPEEDHILVVAEMPGIAVEDIEIRFHGQTMRLSGDSGRVQFSKTIKIEHDFQPEDVDVAVNNGIVEIKLKSANPSA